MEIIFAKNDNLENVSILTEKLNQHGLICGATGSGKTVTLKVLTEHLSDLGIPVILSDVKGDLANLVNPGDPAKVQDRLDQMDIKDFQASSFPVNLWDVYGDEGLPLRVSISQMGPVFLGTILELNEVQLGVLNIAFRIADSQGLLLLDLKDLKSILRLIQENREEVSKEYGQVSGATIAAIQRKILLLEDMGGNLFFSEPSLDIDDLLAEDKNHRGIINILSARKLISNPRLYSMFLLWMLSELYERLPEVGDKEFPKLVFFFDEAHLLFANASRDLNEKILQLVRLIRSKGVGIFFVSQNPLDIPDPVSSQLGTKIVHQLRAFSPREIRMIKEISQSLRHNEDFNLEEVIQNLRTGEAIITSPDQSGQPRPVEKALIYPPRSSFEALNLSDYNRIIQDSIFYDKYFHGLDRESAYELLAVRFEEEARLLRVQEEEKKLQAEKKKQIALEREKQREKNNSPMTKIFNSALYSFSRQIGREIARGLLGSFKKK
ncbi:MAG: DUF853 family protein [Bacillota bacterium]|nr:DUF853 family protein [Bacillota bacterium]